MRKGLATAAALFAALLLQTAVLPAFGVASVAPDLIFAVLVPSAMLWNPEYTALMGAATGLVMDILFGHAIGPNALPYLAVPWLATVYGRQFYRENAFFPAGIAGGAVLARAAAMALFIYLGRMELQITWGFVFRTAASALMTAGVSIPWHLVYYSFLIRNERRQPGMFLIGR